LQHRFCSASEQKDWPDSGATDIRYCQYQTPFGDEYGFADAREGAPCTPAPGTLSKRGGRSAPRSARKSGAGISDQMVQVKKPAVRDAILSAAYRLFRDQGYNGTTLSEIAQKAGVSTANLYSYFRSKFDILYCIYDPWLHDRFRRLEQELNGIRDPKRRLRHLIVDLRLFQQNRPLCLD
jgi:hypothetical protein